MRIEIENIMYYIQWKNYSYVKNQLNEDIVLCQLSLKEYFKKPRIKKELFQWLNGE